jgi:hypothetical protein
LKAPIHPNSIENRIRIEVDHQIVTPFKSFVQPFKSTISFPDSQAPPAIIPAERRIAILQPLDIPQGVVAGSLWRRTCQTLPAGVQLFVARFRRAFQTSSIPEPTRSVYPFARIGFSRAGLRLG